MRHTKIVASISDARCNVDFLQLLYKAGMNVARINTAHITKEGGIKVLNNIRSVSEQIAILIDTKGPEIRICNLPDPVPVTRGQIIQMSGKSQEAGDCHICVSYLNFVDDVPLGSQILIDDGDIELTVSEKTADYLVCRVENDGVIRKKKSLNVPGISFKLPSVTERDKEFILFAIENELDFIAHSFVRNKEDVLEVQKILDQHNSDIKIIAKIENLDGVNNIDEILDYAYGIMVARGDLGIEIPSEKIPNVQRELVHKAIEKKKPVIIATQMLHTMIEHPRPTRAEVSDVAHAIFSRTDAIMLSGETAHGAYPVEAVQTMDRIAREVESSTDHSEIIAKPSIEKEVLAKLSQSAIKSSGELGAKSIITTTTTGKTPRYLAAFRANVPVYAKCHLMRVVREMALSYGIEPSYLEIKKNKFKIEQAAIDSLLKSGDIKDDDLVIYIGGRFGVDHGASFIEISAAEKLKSIKKK